MPQSTAKVFMNGRSQAVRLPKEFRVDTKEVFVTSENGRIVLTPKPESSWEEFFAMEPCPEFELDRDMSPPERRELF